MKVLADDLRREPVGRPWIPAAEAEYELAMGTLEPGLAARYRERCREATREGGGPADGEAGLGSLSILSSWHLSIFEV